MAGVRISHPSETSCTYTLVDARRPYRSPFACPVCLRTHEFKTYHITLDALGFAIVSPAVWHRLKGIGGQPFAVANEVAAPPPQVVGGPLDRSALPAIVEHPAAPGRLARVRARLAG